MERGHFKMSERGRVLLINSTTQNSKKEVTIMARISKIIALAALIMTAFLLMSVIQAGAATMKFRIVMFHTKAEIINVGDVEGHIIGAGETTGLASFETGEVAVVALKWTVDYIIRNRSRPEGIHPPDVRRWVYYRLYGPGQNAARSEGKGFAV